MQQRPIGNRTVSAIGLGEMPLSIEGRPDRARRSPPSTPRSMPASPSSTPPTPTRSGSHEHGHGEELVAEALAAYGGATDDVVVATKGGHRRPGDGSWTVHGDPAYVKEACEASLKRLGVDAIGLYQYHRPDPKVPVGRVRGRAGRPARRGQDPHGRRLQRHRRADRRGAAGAGRPPGQRAEPVLAALPLLGGRARALREARHRLHPLEPAGRHRPRRRHRAHLPRLRPGGGGGGRHAPSRSPWPGCWPRAPGSSRSRAAAAPRPPSPRPRRPTSRSRADQVARLDAS